MDVTEKINASVDFIRSIYSDVPQMGLILGSGFSFFQNSLENSQVISYKDIPHFPESTVEGHAGNLVLGKLKDKTVCMMAGRFHYYEGYGLDELTFPIRVMEKLGIKSLIVTNAAGGINKSYNVGDLVLLIDHINLLGSSPLRGQGQEAFGGRFVDMTNIYDADYRKLAKQLAQNHDIQIHEGVYVATHGPNFETPAEIRMMRTMGADVVGMSTVPEVIVGRQMKLRILGISCVTNMAAGVLNQELSHLEVMETMEQNKKKFSAFIEELVGKM